MKIIVNTKIVEIVEEEEFNSGEYNVDRCIFSFSKEYEQLTKKALFTNSIGTYEVPIINNECIVPAEILRYKGPYELGLYAYEASDEDNELILRYSPQPTSHEIKRGSYKSGTLNCENITPTQYEQYSQKLDEGIREVASNIEEMQVMTKTGRRIISDCYSAAQMATEISILLNNNYEEGKFNGGTFRPDVDPDGNISWTNDKDLENPKTMNIMGPPGKIGPQGEQGLQGLRGETGATFIPNVDSEGNLSWTNDKELDNPQTQNIRGPQGEKGDCNFATFDVIDGKLIMYKTDDRLLDFRLNGNKLEVLI